MAAEELRQTKMRQRERPQVSAARGSHCLTTRRYTISGPYKADNIDRILQFAQRVASATTVKEFAIVISEANLTLNKQEWNCFIAECRRLKNESKQKEDTL